MVGKIIYNEIWMQFHKAADMLGQRDNAKKKTNH